MGLGGRIEKGFGKVDKFVGGLGRKAEGAVGSVNKIANKAEKAVNKTVKKADQVFEKGVDTANKAVQEASKVGGKAIETGYKIARKVDRGLDTAARAGLGDVAGIGEVLAAARGVSEGAKRGLGQANEYNEKLKKLKLEKNSIRKKAIEMAKGDNVNKTFV